MPQDKRESAAKSATLQVLMPGRAPRNIGVLLLDLGTGILYWRITSNWQDLDADGIEILEALDDFVAEQVREVGGRALYERIADTWSNAVALVDEHELWVSGFEDKVNMLYRESVDDELSR